MSENEQVVIGLVSISDRASKGVYKDEGLPALDEWLGKAIRNPRRVIERLIPDQRPKRTPLDVIDPFLDGEDDLPQAA